MKRLGLLFLAGCATGPGPFVDAFRDSVERLQEKDQAGAAIALARAARLDPRDDLVLYLTARTKLRLGRPEEALRALTRLDALGSDLVPVASDFAALAGDARFQRLAAAAQARADALGRNVTEAFRGSEAGLVPEGIARDGTGAFFLGSIQRRKIVRIRDGKSDELVPTVRGFHAFLGLRVDEPRKLLWAATEADPDEDGFRPDDAGHSELVAFDLATGEPRARHSPPGGGKHLFNDLALAADGTLFVTDSEAGTVWTLGPGETALRPLVPAGRLVYPNGIAWDEATRTLFVADTLAIWRVRPESGELAPLPFRSGAALAGVDGLYLAGDWLIGVQNLAGPGRVVAWRLDRAHREVVERRVLVSAHPAFAVPTTGALARGALYLLANSTINGANREQPPIVLKVPLPF
jgi:sugar lactone lactonase YvrE